MRVDLPGGGPAYPVERMTAHAMAATLVDTTNEQAYIAAIQQLSSGITKREYFAALAPEAPDWFVVTMQGDPKPGAEVDDGAALYQWKERYSVARYFAWRRHYAESMLRELATP